jgi:hypothetical protein
LALTVNTSSAPAAVIALAVPVWVCIASTVMTAPRRAVGSKAASSVRTAGISLLFAVTASWPGTAPVA